MDINSQDYYENAASIVADIRTIINLSYDFISEDNVEFVDNLESLRSIVIDIKSVMTDTRVAHEGMILSVRNIQRMSSHLNKAKRRLIGHSNIFVDELISNIDVLEQAIQEIDVLIGKVGRS